MYCMECITYEFQYTMLEYTSENLLFGEQDRMDGVWSKRISALTNNQYGASSKCDSSKATSLFLYLLLQSIVNLSNILCWKFDF